MKRVLNQSIKTVAAGIVAVLVLSVINLNAQGQPQPDRGRGGPPDRGGRDQGGGDRGRGGWGGGLDDKQRELYSEALQKSQDKLAKLNEDLEAAQRELMKATLAEKYDENVVRQKAAVVAKLQTDMTVLRAQALSTVAPTLKPEQRESLENTRFGPMILTSGWFDRGGFGGRGGR